MPRIDKSEYPYNVIYQVVDEDTVLPSDIKGSFEYMLFLLTDKERSYIHAYFKDGLSIIEIAKTHSITKQGVQYLIAKALRKMRQPALIKYIMIGVKNMAYDQATNKILCEISSLRKVVASHLVDSKDMIQQYADIPIKDLNLSVRCYNCLVHTGIKTLDEIAALKPVKLASIKNLGQKCYSEIINVLYTYGYDVTPHHDFLHTHKDFYTYRRMGEDS